MHTQRLPLLTNHLAWIILCVHALSSKEVAILVIYLIARILLPLLLSLCLAPLLSWVLVREAPFLLLLLLLGPARGEFKKRRGVGQGGAVVRLVDRRGVEEKAAICCGKKWRGVRARRARKWWQTTGGLRCTCF